jgi:O-antigen ligase
MSSAHNLWNTLSPRGRGIQGWVFLAAVGFFGLLTALAIASEQFGIAAAIVGLPLLVLAPVQISLGVFAFTVPFSSLFLVAKGVTLSWLIGAVTGPILLGYGLGAKRLRMPPVTAFWWGLFAAWTSASISWAIDADKSMERLPSVISLFLLYLAASSIRFETGQRSAVVGMTIAGGVVAAMFAISQFAQGIGWAGIPVRASLIIGDRSANPNDFASSLLLPLALSIGAFLSATVRRRRMIAATAAATLALCILLTMSRGTLLAVAAVMLTFAWRVRIQKRILIPVGILLVPLAFLPGQFYGRLAESFSSRGQGRFDIWEVAVQIIRKYGVFGAGLENFRLAYNQFAGYAGVFRGFDRDPHNIYLQMVSETGVVGLLLFGIAIVSQLRMISGLSKSQVNRNFMLIAAEAASYGLLVHGLAANILWSKHFWLAWIVVTMFARSSWAQSLPSLKLEPTMDRRSESAWQSATARSGVLMLLVGVWLGGWATPKAEAAQRHAKLDFYVAADGSDSNDGTAKHPWASIQRAAKAVRPGATVHVMPGVYALSNIVETEASGTSEARIRYVAEPRWGAKLITSATQAWANTGAYVDIEGFDISSATMTTTIGIHSEGVKDRVIGNRIHDLHTADGACPSGGAIMMGGGATGQSAIGNVIYNVGPAPGTCNQIHGIYAATADCTVINNLTFHIAGKGIHLWGSSSHSVVTNKTTFDNQDGIVVGADPAHGQVNDGTLVANNISYRNVRYGIYEFGATGPQNRYVNNLVFGNPKPFGLLSGRESGTVYADPQFSNYTGTIAGDYHLRPGSPAHGKGTKLNAPETDLDLNPRKSATPDLGAYESNASL